MSSQNGWIGVDLDGTLAHYDGWKGPEHIGEPITPMVERVKQWIAEGKTVKIFTARAYCPPEPMAPWMYQQLNPNVSELPDMRKITEAYEAWRTRWLEMVSAVAATQRWCEKHIGKVLDVTNVKDFAMIELWDDRAVQVVPNTGITVTEYAKAVASA